MNLTISFLQISSLSQSPFLNSNGKNFVDISKSHFNRFSSQLFFSAFRPNSFSARFSDSKFTNFISSVVRIDSESHIGLKYTSTYTPDTDTSASFQKCNFQNCQSSECGGAILIDDYAFVINISACVFSGCSSEKNGGAIYADCKSSKLKRTHFLKCNSGLGCSYQAFYISLKGVLEADSIQIAKNGDQNSQDSFSTFNIRKGISNSKQFNVTKNVVNSFGACFATTLSKTSQLYVSYSNFIQNRNSDRELFAFFHCSDTCELGRLNIVENIGGSTSLLFNAISNSHVTIHHSVIIKNRVSTLASISDLNLILFERCVCDMEQTASRTVHNIDSTFKQGEYNTIQIMKV